MAFLGFGIDQILISLIWTIKKDIRKLRVVHPKLLLLCFLIFKWVGMWVESNKKKCEIEKLWENSTARKEVRYSRKWNQLRKDKGALMTPLKWLRIGMIIPWNYRISISKRFWKLNAKSILNGMLSFCIWCLM